MVQTCQCVTLSINVTLNLSPVSDFDMAMSLCSAEDSKHCFDHLPEINVAQMDNGGS